MNFRPGDAHIHEFSRKQFPFRLHKYLSIDFRGIKARATHIKLPLFPVDDHPQLHGYLVLREFRRNSLLQFHDPGHPLLLHLLRHIISQVFISVGSFFVGIGKYPQPVEPLFPDKLQQRLEIVVRFPRIAHQTGWCGSPHRVPPP